MLFANCTAFAAILYTTLSANNCFEIKNLRLCSKDEDGIVLNLLNFEQK